MKKIFLFFIFLIFRIFIMFSLEIEVYELLTYKEISEPRQMITEVLNAVHENIKDMNNDKAVNCIDYTLLFKLTWDKLYPEYCDNCEIVRNFNIVDNYFHHLFIMINLDNTNVMFVEPQAFAYEDTFVVTYWGDKFNMNYNIYGETDFWLEQVN